MEGEQFGRYLLLELLGRGGMGEVWRAHDTVADRTVALKRLVPRLADDPAFTSRFRRECAVAARISDPHIVAILDVGEIDGRLYLAMQFVDGADLGALLERDGPLPPERAVHVIEQLAAALDAAHREGLVHRDVKPSNALVTATGATYLTDFGIARADEDTSVTTAGTTIGTLAYMAPERFEDAPLDGRVDIYALACVLHEALTARKPFPVTGPVALMSAHLFTPPPRPSMLRSGIPPALDDVVARGMAKNPAQRHPTAGALAAHARASLTGPAPAGPTDVPSRSRRPVVLVALSVLLVAATATLFVLAPWRATGTAGPPTVTAEPPSPAPTTAARGARPDRPPPADEPRRRARRCTGLRHRRDRRDPRRSRAARRPHRSPPCPATPAPSPRTAPACSYSPRTGRSRCSPPLTPPCSARRTSARRPAG